MVCRHCGRGGLPKIWSHAEMSATFVVRTQGILAKGRSSSGVCLIEVENGAWRQKKRPPGEEIRWAPFGMADKLGGGGLSAPSKQRWEEECACFEFHVHIPSGLRARNGSLRSGLPRPFLVSLEALSASPGPFNLSDEVNIGRDSFFVQCNIIMEDMHHLHG